MDINYYEDIATEINNIGQEMGYTKIIKKGDVSVLMHPLRKLTRNRLNMVIGFINAWNQYGLDSEISKKKSVIIMNHYTTIFRGKNITELNNVELYAHLFSPILIPGCSKNTIASLMDIIALTLER